MTKVPKVVVSLRSIFFKMTGFRNFSHFLLQLFHHGDFIAVREFDADDTVPPDF
jgi:hypothetical protein